MTEKEASVMAGGTLQRRSSVAVDTDEQGQPVSIYYELHRLPSSTDSGVETNTAPIRVLFIMGFAATSSAWYPLLLQLQRLWARQEGPCLQALLMDNRGVGYSSSPRSRAAYTTTRMARDALAVMDHVSWSNAHVVGFSMGGMISLKLAAQAVDRVRSLAVLSATGGGAQALPRTWRAIRYAFRAILAKTAELRAEMDLKFHFTKKTLKRVVPHLGVSVRDVLHAEYLATSRSGRPQPEHGFKGQGAAVWNHNITDEDVRDIQMGKCPVWFLHGRHDLIAAPHYAEQLAARFGAPCVCVDGAHFIPRENAVEVALLLQSLFTLGHASPGGFAHNASDFAHLSSLDGLALQLGVGAGIAASMTGLDPSIVMNGVAAGAAGAAGAAAGAGGGVGTGVAAGLNGKVSGTDGVLVGGVHGREESFEIASQPLVLLH